MWRVQAVLEGGPLSEKVRGGIRGRSLTNPTSQAKRNTAERREAAKKKSNFRGEAKVQKKNAKNGVTSRLTRKRKGYS